MHVALLCCSYWCAAQFGMHLQMVNARQNNIMISHNLRKEGKSCMTPTARAWNPKCIQFLLSNPSWCPILVKRLPLWIRRLCRGVDDAAPWAVWSEDNFTQRE